MSAGGGGVPSSPVSEGGSSSQSRPDIAAFFEQRFSKPTTGYGSTAPVSYDEAVQSHPFVHQAHYHTTLNCNGVIRDGNGTVVAVHMKAVLPVKATVLADEVLRAAATRTSLRAGIFGGVSPLSGIAGYFDYAGSPIEYKCRKTSYTCEVLQSWPKVYPMVEYANALYKALKPDEWAKQNRAIPDVVRIRDTVFSTLTINQRFRTAQHTDAGDFDEGFGLITCMNGEFEGLNLGFPRLGVCVRLEPGDILLFNTHHYHANTELERLSEFGDSGFVDWSRMTCVFYYRANLGDLRCLKEYDRRHGEARADEKTYIADAANAATEQKKHDAEAVVESLKRFPGKTLPPNDNGVNLNRPAALHVPCASPFLGLLASADSSQHLGVTTESLAAILSLHDALGSHTAFGDFDVSATQCMSVLGQYRQELSGRLRLDAIAIREAMSNNLAVNSLDISNDANAKALATKINAQVFSSNGANAVHLLHELLFDEPCYADIPAGLEERQQASRAAKKEASIKQAFAQTSNGSNATAPTAFAQRRSMHRVVDLNRCDEDIVRDASSANAPSAVPPGLEPHSPEELARVNLDTGHTMSMGEGGSKLGGFSETPTLLEHGAKNYAFLADTVLRDILAPGLFTKWIEAKDAWLGHVAADWTKMLKLNPLRTDFSWNNRGDISTTFFALCDVAHQVMIEVLQKEDPTPMESGRFWLAFAFHLHDLCQTRNKMPPTAMSIKKINVKLKDHKFGGTRYFEDQSPEEQARRLKRKERLAEARALGLSSGRKHANGDDDDDALETWLDNDRFDYQSEDVPVDYAALGLPLPDAVGNAVKAWFQTHDQLLGQATAPHKARRSEAGSPDAAQRAAAAVQHVLVVRCRSSGTTVDAKVLLDVADEVVKVREEHATADVYLWRRLGCDAETAAIVAKFIAAHASSSTNASADVNKSASALAQRITAIGTAVRQELRRVAKAKAEARAKAEAAATNAAVPAKAKPAAAKATKADPALEVNAAIVATAVELTTTLVAALRAVRPVEAQPTVQRWDLRCGVADGRDDSRGKEVEHQWCITRVTGSPDQLADLLRNRLAETKFHLALLLGAGGCESPVNDVYAAWRDVVHPHLRAKDERCQGAVVAVEHNPQDAHHFMLPRDTRVASERTTSIAVAVLSMLTRNDANPNIADLPRLRTRHELEAGLPSHVRGHEQRERRFGYLSLYQLPRSPCGSFLAVLPDASAANGGGGAAVPAA